MPTKTILVYFGNETQVVGLTKAAVAVARDFGAHVVGLHVVPGAFIPSGGLYEMTGELIEAQRQANAAAGNRVAEAFGKAIANEGVPFEWRSFIADFEPVAAIVMRQGRETDLVVLGQPTNAITLIDGVATSEEVMLGLGRPVLIIPERDGRGGIGKRVLLTWNASRESARAVFDALPFLQKAESVRLLAAKPVDGSSGGPGTDVSHKLGILASLERHGVRCRFVEATPADADATASILAQAKEHDCDLIVMGGYGHWRIREIVFGWATRGVLNQATIPVLMSH